MPDRVKYFVMEYVYFRLLFGTSLENNVESQIVFWMPSYAKAITTILGNIVEVKLQTLHFFNLQDILISLIARHNN